MFQFDGSNGVASKPAYGAAATPAWFSAGDPTASPPVPASNPGQDWFNMMTAELLGVLTAASVTPSKSNDAQLAAAIKAMLQSAAGNYAADTGTANAMAATLSPVPASMAALTGATVRVRKIASANTGALTLNLNSLGAVAVTWADGSALSASDAPANAILQLVCTGTAFVLLSVSARPVMPGDFTGSLATSGWEKLPNGSILQWGNSSFGDIGGTTSVSVTFPTTFPTACYQVIPTAGVTAGFVVSAMISEGSITTSGCTIAISEWSAVTQTGGQLRWFAIGK